MKPLRVRLQEVRKRLGIPWEVLERDYLLSWLLAGIEEVDVLRDTIAFKGGTALKKCYGGSLSFLGFGLPPGVPSWGGMLSREGRQYMEMARRGWRSGRACA